MLPMRTTKNFPYDLRIALIEGGKLTDPPLRVYDAMIDGGFEFGRVHTADTETEMRR